LFFSPFHIFWEVCMHELFEVFPYLLWYTLNGITYFLQTYSYYLARSCTLISVMTYIDSHWITKISY